MIHLLCSRPFLRPHLRSASAATRPVVAGLAAVLVAAVLALPAGAADNAELERLAATGKVGEEVLAALDAEAAGGETTPRARVLVALRLPVSATALDLSSAAGHAAIARTADAVLEALPEESFTVRRRFQSIEAVAGDVTLQGLDALAADPRVVRIDIDAPGTGSLAQSVPQVNLDTVRTTLGLTGAGIQVAVLDSGIDTDHPDLSDDLIGQRCFADSCPGGAFSAEDDNGHGSNVSGIITSRGTIAPVGGAPDAEIYAIKVLDSNNSFSAASIVLAGLDFVINSLPQIDLVNMSLGTGATFSGNCDTATSFTIAFASAVNTLRGNGVLSFASSGNGSSNTTMTAPACVANAIAVGAVWDTSPGTGSNPFCSDPSPSADDLTCFTNTSTTTDIVAPGAPMTSTGRFGNTSTFFGTSQATPLVLACAAVLRQHDPSLAASAIENLLETTTSVQVQDRVGRFIPRLDCVEAVLATGAAFEAGTITTNQPNATTYRSQGLTTAFANPIVVLGPPTKNGGQPMTVRTRNVTSGGFEWQMDEWDYLDGAHISESVGYLAVEAGRAFLGTLAVEAGTVNVNHGFVTVSFSQPFPSVPVVLAQVASSNGPEAVTDRIRNVTTTGFQVRVQEEEANAAAHATELVHYIAIETGVTSVGGQTLVVDRAGGVGDTFTSVLFSAMVTSPSLIARQQTYTGANTAALRMTGLTSTGVQLQSEEEQSLDSEVAHVGEQVGYVVVGN